MMAIGLNTYKLAKRIRDKAATLLLKSGFGGFGARSVISLPFRSGLEKRMTIGSGVFVGDNCWFEVMQDGEGQAIVIGDDVAFSGFCTITAAAKVEIGAGALIARHVYISDHSHRFDDPDVSIRRQGITQPAPVFIGPGAWLGQGVVICPGVTIGRNAVIGANSVVKCDVPDFAVAVGSPARIVKTRNVQPLSAAV